MVVISDAANALKKLNQEDLGGVVTGGGQRRAVWGFCLHDKTTSEKHSADWERRGGTSHEIL